MAFVTATVSGLFNESRDFETIQFFLKAESAQLQTTIAQLGSLITESFGQEPQTNLQASATDIFAQGAQRMSRYLDEMVENQSLDKLKKITQNAIATLKTRRTAQDLDQFEAYHNEE